MYEKQTQNFEITEHVGLDWRPYNEYGFASPWAPCLSRVNPKANYLISALISFLIVLVFVWFSDRCRHWCLLPLLFCGVLAGSDIIAWFRKEIDPFDPKAMVAGVLYLNCFLAPQLHLAYNIYGSEFDVTDWPKYFGIMAFFNIGAILCLKISQKLFFNITRPVKTLWTVAAGKFILVLMPIFILSLAASTIIGIFFGGLIKEQGTLNLSMGAESYAANLSILLMLGDAFPTLLLMTIIYWLSNKKPDMKHSIATVLVVLVVASVLQFLFVGLRGSRSAIMGSMYIITVIIHYRLRPFSIKFVVIGMCVAFLFIHLYGFYKHLSGRGWEAFYSSKAREEMIYERRGGGTILGTLVGDLARADVQAFMVYRLMEFPEQYHYRFGLTYKMSALTFIPRAIWPSKPFAVKARAGTEISGYGETVISSRVYGLAGEGMLNFGLYGIIPPFFVFGAFLGWLRKKLVTMEPSDSRFFIFPILLLVCELMILSDTENWMYGLLQMGILPFIVVFFGSLRTRLTS
jgi:hypothetical protein